MSKKIIVASALVALFAGIGTAFGQDANLMKYVQILAPTASLATTGTAVNVAAYKGNATLGVQFSSTAVACTNTVTFYHAAAATGVYSRITNSAGTAAVLTQTGPKTNDVQTYPIDLARLHPYVIAVLAQSGQDTNTASAFMVAPMKSE